jgi:hypothetical protein
MSFAIVRNCFVFVRGFLASICGGHHRAGDRRSGQEKYREGQKEDRRTGKKRVRTVRSARIDSLQVQQQEYFRDLSNRQVPRLFSFGKIQETLYGQCRGGVLSMVKLVC